MVAAAPYIEVKDLTAAYGDKVVVHGVSFSVAPGEHLSLLGPSGCGKSTTLRCIAGLETPASGEIVIDSQVVFSSAKGINVPTEKRNLSMVFQSYAIWPHMTVFDNVAYGLRTRKSHQVDIKAQVASALEMVGMKDFASRPATDLSGGQQQRVALARSYACHPKVILLDEPLSNLDARLRTRMREEMKDLQQKFEVSTLYVTHDQEEAMAMSNRVIVMREGNIEQEGPPLEIYNHPRSRFVADFIGAANIITGKLVGPADGTPVLELEGGVSLRCAPRAHEPRPGPDGKQAVAVRSVYAELGVQPSTSSVNQWSATIERRILLGDIVTYFVRWPGGLIRVHGFPGALLEEGAAVFLSIPAERAVLVDA
ncbi:MAG TPA: ABC transporter ATP-binding protein [Castellaniella sp.]|uniref:ABC transporter ATP-binding protein n=1 Tax=Castellaniella sp. TaxID=1955812 RepID=UPI002F01C1E9